MKLHEKVKLKKDENGVYEYDTEWYGWCLYKLYPFLKEMVSAIENKDKDYTTYLALEYLTGQLYEQNKSLFDLCNETLWGDTPIEKLFYQCFNYICWCEKIKIFLIPQVEIEIDNKAYRVDFLVCCEYLSEDKARKYIVECDGFEYHSSSKQQAKDNQRQRDLENAGYTVIRFSGSEIYNDPVKCVYETLKRLDIEVKE